jgi:hypothetical protein
MQVSTYVQAEYMLTGEMAVKRTLQQHPFCSNFWHSRWQSMRVDPVCVGAPVRARLPPPTPARTHPL